MPEIPRTTRSEARDSVGLGLVWPLLASFAALALLLGRRPWWGLGVAALAAYGWWSLWGLYQRNRRIRAFHADLLALVNIRVAEDTVLPPFCIYCGQASDHVVAVREERDHASRFVTAPIASFEVVSVLQATIPVCRGCRRLHPQPSAVNVEDRYMRFYVSPRFAEHLPPELRPTPRTEKNLHRKTRAPR